MNPPTMADRVDAYLSYRRALGYQLRIEGQMLHSFARYADGSGHCGPLTTELALRWARLPEQAARVYQARRLELVRTLARYLAPREQGTEVPPRGLLGSAHTRQSAFIYTETNVAALIDTARALGPADSLRPRTFATLIGLLACTGLRISEALTLQDEDADLDIGVLTIRQTKFHKSRLVPLHTSALKALRDYVTARDSCSRDPRSTTFFVSDAGQPLRYGTVRHTFHKLLERAMPGVVPLGRVRPRVYDLRHTFACRRLLAWYRDGTDVARVIDQLSAYLGHAKVTDTYWYLEAIPELFALAGDRFEQFADSSREGGT